MIHLEARLSLGGPIFFIPCWWLLQACWQITNEGVAALAELSSLKELSLAEVGTLSPQPGGFQRGPLIRAGLLP